MCEDDLSSTIIDAMNDKCTQETLSSLLDLLLLTDVCVERPNEVLMTAMSCTKGTEYLDVLIECSAFDDVWRQGDVWVFALTYATEAQLLSLYNHVQKRSHA